MTTARPASGAPQLPDSFDQNMTFVQLLEVCSLLVATGFLPKSIKTPAQAAAIIIAGRELGMPMMRALRSLQLVNGNVGEKADSQLGRFKAAGGKATFTTLNAREAALELEHPNGDKHTQRFTFEDAERAGLTTRSPNKPDEPSMYEKFPEAMMRSRAITFGLKSVGWDGGAGVYDPSEIEHDDELNGGSYTRAEVDAVNTARAVTVQDAEHAVAQLHAGRVSEWPAQGVHAQPAEVVAVSHEQAPSDGGAVDLSKYHEPANGSASSGASDAPSDAQRAYVTRLAGSTLFSPHEKKRLLGVTTRKDASAAIEWAKAELDKRAGAAKAASKEQNDKDRAAQRSAAEGDAHEEAIERAALQDSRTH